MGEGSGDRHGWGDGVGESDRGELGEEGGEGGGVGYL